MHAVKLTLLVLLVTILSVGLVYAQLCNTACALYGCSPSAVARNMLPGSGDNAAREESQSECSKHNRAGRQLSKEQSHTRQDDPTPIPQNQGDSHQSEGCPAHADQTALMSAAATSSCAATHSNSQPADGGFPVEESTPIRMLAGLSFIIKPDRSPPRRTASVLRI
jgi:hypothetical protein